MTRPIKRAGRVPAAGDRITQWIRGELLYRYGIDFAFRGTPMPLKSPNPSSPTWHFGDGMSYAAGDYLDAIGKVNRVIEMAQERFDLVEDPDGI